MPGAAVGSGGNPALMARIRGPADVRVAVRADVEQGDGSGADPAGGSGIRGAHACAANTKENCPPRIRPCALPVCGCAAYPGVDTGSAGPAHPGHSQDSGGQGGLCYSEGLARILLAPGPVAEGSQRPRHHHPSHGPGLPGPPAAQARGALRHPHPGILQEFPVPVQGGAAAAPGRHEEEERGGPADPGRGPGRVDEAAGAGTDGSNPRGHGQSQASDRESGGRRCCGPPRIRRRRRGVRRVPADDGRASPGRALGLVARCPGGPRTARMGPR
mmetsp:Transcript_90872/g.243366  ORF Transcript_90872/g.243366 Transcript_90872/m.243366 type:complete len:273 (+) Transcript_90872:2502-3320(+)